MNILIERLANFYCFLYNLYVKPIVAMSGVFDNGLPSNLCYIMFILQCLNFFKSWKVIVY
ncbi:hypothetical protein DID74_00430 [Candidatus Marinamargulisbacteria bacterium SCGC AG-333-B06]|nr:hypothetical protein DID74_00430 [Candidatus Marinamargulisbacteria bacterium SCGC AG-333-B06]